MTLPQPQNASVDMESDPFIVRLNIAHFRALLQTKLDEPTRQMVCRLLAELQTAQASVKAPSAAD